MTDSMKFGPEWLRNLSSEGNTSSTSGGGNRYQLAEHRYGREEMLALFEQSLKLRPPASILSFTTLYVDQALNPLALAPMTEEENRMWSGRGVPPGAPRGRGGSMDRGRGRGRGGTFHPGFSRSNSSYDESLRSFDRSQSDRGWAERNGDMNDWTVGSSPRKEYGNPRGGSNNTDNWRRHRMDDPDSDGWRTANHRSSGIQEKWNASGGRNMSGNWRDGDTRDEHSHLSDRQANSRVSWHSSGDSRTPSQRRIFDVDDHLPEWATENPSESGGTFDASGAFHGSDDEFPPEKGSTSTRSNNSGNNSILQKSASQQNIPQPMKPTPLSTSQSATNLIKKSDESGNKESNKEKNEREEKSSPQHQPPCKKDVEISNIKIETDKQISKVQQPIMKEVAENNISKKTTQVINSSKPETVTNIKKVDDEFDHMKEVTDDIVAKLILDDELPKPPTINETQQQQRSSVNSGGVTPMSYPSGLMPPPPGTSQDKWFYRDPQGEVQGPFTSQEMADWFRAGYFTISLLVRRQCDERYFTLGDLVKQCPGIPFLTCRLPPLKHDPVSMGLGKVPGAPELGDPLQIQQQLHIQNLMQRHAEAVRALSQTEPWGGLSHIQQRELITQHMMTQTQGLSDLPFMPQIPNTQLNNPLMHMINQMQQANKLPVQPPVVEKPPNSIGTQHLDPLQQLVQQMGGMQPPMQTPAPAAADPTQQPEDPIKSLLRQLANQQPPRDIWDLRGPQAPFSNQQPQPQQWQAHTPAPGPLPHSMWDLHSQNNVPVVPPPIVTPTNVAMQRQPQPSHAVTTPTQQQPSSNLINDTIVKEQEKEDQKKKAEMEKELKARERKEAAEREKRKKEQEQLEKIKAQKEAEEKRKEEQRKREAERKAEVEKQKKEEERVRKELEKAKREAEEKKAKELEEKRKLKEQKKAEEELRKKQEEERKKEEEEKQKKEIERQEQARRQAEALRRMQEQQQRTKVAPWCQTANETNSLSLADIQRAEREKRAEQAALLLQQQRAMAAAKEVQEQQALDKSAIQLKWAIKKPAQSKKVKSLAEIQAEEQERIAKQAAEARLLLQQKEKESVSVPPTNVHTSIWSTASQSLTWATNAHTTSGFWDDSPNVQKTPTKPNTTKSNATSNNSTSNQQQQQHQQQQQQQTNNKANGKATKSRVKKEEQQVMKLFDKNDKNDEFTTWCTKTLATLNSDVDIPTFVGFLRDIESPYEVKDYVRQYLGDSSQALHFANQFVERRSRVKELQRAALQHKDDLCQPAPAINPATEFQEVKGKGKKSKKSKMMKVDARILGFSVTAAEDRINVGDRDYGDSI